MATSNNTMADDDLVIDLTGHDYGGTITIDHSDYIDVSSISIDDIYTIDGVQGSDDLIWNSHNTGESINITATIKELSETVEVLREVLYEVAPGIDFERRVEQKRMIKKLSKDG